MAARVSDRGADELGRKTHTRAKNRKSRFGCGECKTKRLKCDETHPSCKQCTKRGRPCPGYQTQYRWSTVHEKIRPPEPTTAFWPQPEHNALLETLPQHQCCKPHAQGRAMDCPAGEACSNERATTSPLDDLILPGDESVAPPADAGPTLDGQMQADQDATSATDTVISVTDFASWDSGHDFDWFDDQAPECEENASLPDIFAELCDPSTWPVDGDATREQRQQSADTALTIRAAKAPTLLYTPVDLSTMLMEYWFSDVCPMWSAFDSPENPHRQLASSAWQHSDAVYFALQSMSAACLVDSLPHVKKYVGLLSSQAVDAIQCGVQNHARLAAEKRNKFPRDLLLAIIAMGTSVCWTDTRQLGLWFLAKAHEVLTQYDSDSSHLDEYSRQELEYFHEALVYWKMLYRVVGSDPRGDLRKRKEVYMRRLRQAMSSDDALSPMEDDAAFRALPAGPAPKSGKALTIHPWTGISTDIQHTFGLVILLCREHRMAGRKDNNRTAAALSDALCDIRMARDLTRELAETDVYAGDHSTSPVTWSRGTGDSVTPISHLVDTAEAYRLAALLLLCQTFPDLDMESIMNDLSAPPSVSHGTGADYNKNTHASLVLAMKLVETLRRVPAESGTRCIQPVLYICAGSGMRFNVTETESHISSIDADQGDATTRRRAPQPHRQSAAMDATLLSSAQNPTVAEFNAASVTKCTLEVSRGRRFVVDRLCALQRSLPPRPIGVALDLVKAIWAEYDYSSDQTSLHWIDVMVDKGLQTLFG